MRTKMIIPSMGAHMILLALFMFVFIGCSKEDDDNNESTAFDPGYVWSEGDYPSLVAPDVNQAPTIGSPVLAETAKHVSDFRPMLRAIYSENWHGDITREEGVLCNDKRVNFDFSSDGYWSTQLPRRDYYFDYQFGALCNDSELENYNISWPEGTKKRITLMKDGAWDENEIIETKNFEKSGNEYKLTRRYNQMTSHPDLYIAMERDWIYESGTDVMEHEGTHKVTTYTKTGVENFDETTFSQTLELGSEASYGTVSANLNATFSGTTTHNVKISSWEYKDHETTYIIPSGETWRFITLHGIERYYFSNSEGNRWESPNNLVLDHLEELENNVRTFVMIVKYNSSSATPFSSKLIEIKH